MSITCRFVVNYLSNGLLNSLRLDMVVVFSRKHQLIRWSLIQYLLSSDTSSWLSRHQPLLSMHRVRRCWNDYNLTIQAIIFFNTRVKMWRCDRCCLRQPDLWSANIQTFRRWFCNIRLGPSAAYFEIGKTIIQWLFRIRIWCILGLFSCLICLFDECRNKH